MQWKKLVFPRSENCLAIGNCTCSRNCTLQNLRTQLSRKKYLLPQTWKLNLIHKVHICLSDLNGGWGGVYISPDRSSYSLLLFVLLLFFFKLGLANMKTAITTVLQLCGQHNLGNNSDFTAVYTPPWFAAVSRHCYFRRWRGFPWGDGPRGQACWALPQAGNEHTSVPRSQARCVPP